MGDAAELRDVWEHHVATMWATLEAMPAESVVVLSSAIDPRRPVADTRTGGTFAELHKRGAIFHDIPLFGFQVHRDGDGQRHSYTPPACVRQAFSAAVLAEKLVDRILTKRSDLRFVVVGRTAQKTTKAWNLPRACSLPYPSEWHVGATGEAAYAALRGLAPDAFPFEYAEFLSAVKVGAITPRQRLAASASMKANWQNPSFAQRCIASARLRLRLYLKSQNHQARTSVKMKMQWKDPAYRAKMAKATSASGKKNMQALWASKERRFAHSKRMSAQLRDRWADPAYRAKMARVASRVGRGVMRALWARESFQLMKRRFYDDPVNRAMFVQCGVDTLKKLRENPLYVAKIKEIHRARLTHLWEEDRAKMMQYQQMAVDRNRELAEDPEHRKKKRLAHVSGSDRDRIAVIQAQAALPKRCQPNRPSKLAAGVVASLRETLASPVAGDYHSDLVYLSWRLAASRAALKALLLKECARLSSVEAAEGLRLWEELLSRPGAGPQEWLKAVDVALVTRLYELNEGFSDRTMALLCPAPTRECDVMRALKANHIALREKSAEAHKRVTPAGVEALAREFPHVEESRIALVCSATPERIPAILELVRRERGQRGSARA